MRLSDRQRNALRLLSGGPLYKLRGAGLWVRNPLDWHRDRMSVIDDPDSFARNDTIKALHRRGLVIMGADSCELSRAGRAAASPFLSAVQRELEHAWEEAERQDDEPALYPARKDETPSRD